MKCIILEYILVLYILIFIRGINYAQTTNYNLANNIGFEHNFNIYNWRYGINYHKSYSQKYFLKVSENFRSSLLRINKDEKKWKDDQRLLIDFSWRFSPKWIGKLIASSLIFSDKLSGVTNDIKTNFGTIGIQSHPIDVINLSSLLGYKFDGRLDQLDNGLTYSFDIYTPFIDIKQYYNKFQFFISGDNFAIRRNKDFNLNYQVNKKFYTDTTDSLSFTWSKRRRDNYDRWDINELYIESLDEEYGTINHTLDYQVNKQIKVKFNSSITAKRTKVSKVKSSNLYEVRSKRDFSSVNQFYLDFNTSILKERIKLSYTTESQKNDVPDSLKASPFSYRFSYISSDFRSSRLSLNNILNFMVSDNDTIATNFLISIFRYDTPEKANFDDRDELRINVNLSEIHHFSRILKLRLNAGVNLNHLVFIYSQKSADNNWMRIFRLNPELYYRPSEKFRLYQTFEILANYVDYDFEQKTNPADIRSYVFRKFTMQHIIKYNLSPITTFNVNYKLELEENGKLFWNDWTEMIITTRRNHYGKVYFDSQLLTGATISLGVVFFKRWEYLHIFKVTNKLPMSNNYISFGPSLKVKFQPHSKINFTLSATRRVIDQVRQKRYFITNMNANLFWYL